MLTRDYTIISDLAPTLAELNGSEALECWDGKSYAPAIQSADDCGWNDLVLSSCWGTCQRSVRFDHWFYTHTYTMAITAFRNGCYSTFSQIPNNATIWRQRTRQSVRTQNLVFRAGTSR